MIPNSFHKFFKVSAPPSVSWFKNSSQNINDKDIELIFQKNLPPVDPAGACIQEPIVAEVLALESLSVKRGFTEHSSSQESVVITSN